MNFKTSEKIWQITGLSMSERLILLALEHNGDQDSFSWYGHAKLGEMTGISVDSKYLTRNLNELEKQGHLMIWRQHGRGGGRGYTHLYLVIVGKSSEEILEIVMRRFFATQEEAEAIISQSGPVYEDLVKRGRVSAKTLEESGAIKKGVPQNTNSNEKGVQIAPHSDNKVYQETPNIADETKKGVLESPRLLKESLKQESNPSKESKRERESHAHKLERIGEVDYLSQNEPFAVKLSEICGNPHPRYVVNGNRKKLAEATAQLLDWDATIDQLDKFKASWSMDSPPYYHQVTGGWGRFLTSLQQPTNGANQNGHYSKPNPQRNTDPDRIPSVDIFEDGWQPPSRSLS